MTFMLELRCRVFFLVSILEIYFKDMVFALAIVLDIIDSV